MGRVEAHAHSLCHSGCDRPVRLSPAESESPAGRSVGELVLLVIEVYSRVSEYTEYPCFGYTPSAILLYTPQLQAGAGGSEGGVGRGGGGLDGGGGRQRRPAGT